MLLNLRLALNHVSSMLELLSDKMEFPLYISLALAFSPTILFQQLVFQGSRQTWLQSGLQLELVLATFKRFWITIILARRDLPSKTDQT